MTMSPAMRKAALTMHVTASVGWLGAVAAFLALAVVGLVGTDGPAVLVDRLGPQSRHSDSIRARRSVKV